MKHLIIVMLFTIGVVVYAEPYPDTLWTLKYGGLEWDFANSIKQTRDGGYVIAGGSGKSFNYKPFILRVDNQGKVEWNATIGGGRGGELNAIRGTMDGGYVVSGYVLNGRENFWDFYYAKLDSAGNLEWEKSLGGKYADVANDIKQTSEGGFIVVGEETSRRRMLSDSSKQELQTYLYMVKTDDKGDTLWTRSYEALSSDGVVSVHQMEDGGYVLGASVYREGITKGGYDNYLLLTDVNGGIIQEYLIGDEKYYVLYNAVPTIDGGYLLGGNIEYDDMSEAYVVKVDSVGETLWKRTYAEQWTNFYIRDMEETSDGGLIMVGDKPAGEERKRDMFLLKIDSLGNKLWYGTFGGGKSDMGHAVCKTRDGGYVIAGFTGFGEDDRDIYIVKTGPDKER